MNRLRLRIYFRWANFVPHLLWTYDLIEFEMKRFVPNLKKSLIFWCKLLRRQFIRLREIYARFFVRSWYYLIYKLPFMRFWLNKQIISFLWHIFTLEKKVYLLLKLIRLFSQWRSLTCLNFILCWFNKILYFIEFFVPDFAASYFNGKIKQLKLLESKYESNFEEVLELVNKKRM